LPDHSEIAAFAAKRCMDIIAQLKRCEADRDSITGIHTAMIVVAAVLIVIFIALIVLLMLYLLCCVKTKRRRRRKRKHRKHRKHRKAPTDTSSKPKDNEVSSFYFEYNNTVFLGRRSRS
jgi:predicted membrane protein